MTGWARWDPMILPARHGGLTIVLRRAGVAVDGDRSWWRLSRRGALRAGRRAAASRQARTDRLYASQLAQ